MIYAETERLVIRALREEDCAELVEYMNDWDVNGPLEHPPFPYTYADAKEFYDKMMRGIEVGKPEFFAICDGGTDEMMGGIGLHPEHSFQQRAFTCEMGYWLGRMYWGQGYMSEAIPPVLDFGFNALKLRMVSATTNVENERSKKVLRGLGFTYLGDHKRVKPTLRGTEVMSCWELSLADYEKRKTE